MSDLLASAPTPAPRPHVRIVAVLATRNEERFIAGCLENLFRQGVQVYLCDNDSTDRTVEIARRYAGVTVVAQSSAGIANAYNEGIMRARCDLLAFVSHDDRWLPNKLESQLAALAARPDALLSFTHVQHVLAEGEAPPPGFRTELLEKPVPVFIMETLVARRAAFERIGFFDPAFAVAEDVDWFSRARDAGLPAVVVPQTLVLKSVHDANASLTHAANNQLLLKALRQSLARKRGPGASA